MADSRAEAHLSRMAGSSPHLVFPILGRTAESRTPVSGMLSKFPMDKNLCNPGPVSSTD